MNWIMFSQQFLISSEIALNNKRYLKKIINNIRKQRPGKRFHYIYCYVNSWINENIIIKIILVIIGVFLVLAGIILLFIPGPGLLFILIALMLFCVSSSHVAHWLDKIEKKIHNHEKSHNSQD